MISQVSQAGGIGKIDIDKAGRGSACSFKIFERCIKLQEGLRPCSRKRHVPTLGTGS